MKRIIVYGLICVSAAICGCTAEKASQPLQKIPAITLAPADKEKLVAFQKELLSVERFADIAVSLAGNELKKVITGGEISLSVPSIITKAKGECLQAGEKLLKNTVPDALPPEAKKILTEGKAGLIDAYKGYAEAYDAMKNFVTDKNPMALLEYRNKQSRAQELFSRSTDKITMIMTAAGIAQ
ncbi:MAG: hypothetical protein PHF56_00100 [Desulfuromonadaceae bacterium]|nr:hypothetical protein [Desulfuromonadaceae bacterium]